MNWLFEQYETPGLGLRLRLRPEVALEASPPGGLNVMHYWGALQLPGLTPGVTTTLKRLAGEWVERSELLSMISMCAPSNVETIAASLSKHLWAFDQLAFLFRFQLVLHDRPLLMVEPLSYASRLSFGGARGSSPRLSRFAFLRRCADGLAMESAVAAHRIILHDEWGALLISNLTNERSPALSVSLDGEPTLAAIGLLDAAGMLEGSERVSAAGFGEELLEMGEFHDLLFHRRSRFGWHDEAFGAEFPYLDKIPPGPAIAPPVSDISIPLPRPIEDSVRVHDLTLTQAIERRVSVRQHGTIPLTLSRLGEFLFRCARARAQYGPAPDAGMPYQASDRPYPSGGGIHDLELYLIASGVQDLAPGAYHYMANRHGLEALPATKEVIEILLQSAMKASAASKPPQLLIKITSRFARMAWKYRSIAYATTLKNVGVLYQTMYLVATAMGLAACALGSGNDVAAEKVLNLAARSEIAVGEFMLGNLQENKPALEERPGRKDPTWQPLIEPGWGRD